MIIIYKLTVGSSEPFVLFIIPTESALPKTCALASALPQPRSNSVCASHYN